MSNRNQRKNPRRRGDYLVECGLVIVPWLALVFAITEYGTALFVRSTMQHATRAGVRYAITYNLVAGMKHDASIMEVVRRNSMGFLKATDIADGKVVIRYTDPTTGAATTSNGPGNIIEVAVENYQWKWVANIWRTDRPMTIAVRSLDRMEGLGNLTKPPARF